jgi:phospholipid/cholesterol/gamma-HCH transport system substrate-binding protein
MKKISLDFFVGVFVLSGMLGLLFLATRVATSDSLSMQKQYQLVANFDHIGGLKVRSPVKSAGVLVGRVYAITLDPNSYQAKVVVDIDTKFKFPKDSSMKIATSGLLGEQYISLEAGLDEAFLENQGVIQKTQSALVLENIIGQFLYNKASETSSKSE